jgi:AcrR family transcriptional regulator
MPASRSSLHSASSAPPDLVSTRILKIARAHFFLHGFRRFTMDDLALEMGMSKKTLYAHFPSKSELIKAVLLNKIDELDASMEAITSQTPLEFPKALSELLASMQKQAGEIQPAFARDLSKDAPELVEILLARRREIIQRTFGRVLAAGRAAKLVRSDISVEFLIEILLGAAEAIATPRNLAQRGITPLECISPILSVFLRGVLTDKGRTQT